MTDTAIITRLTSMYHTVVNGVIHFSHIVWPFFASTFARMQRLNSRAGSETALPGFIITFDVFQSVALFILLVALLAALFSRFVSRMKTWFSLLISFIIYCISFLLLAGGQTGAKPPLGLCLVQAGLIYAAPPLVAAAAFVFVIELYLRLSAVTLARKVNERVIYWIIWILPVVHTVAFWVPVQIGLADIKTIRRHPAGLYCQVNQIAAPIFTGVLVILFSGPMVIIEVYTGVHLYRRRFSIRQLSARQTEFPLKLFFSMAMVTVLGLLAIVIVFILNGGSTSGSVLNMLTVLPCMVALVFGCQMDILRALIYWRKPKTDSAQDSSEQSFTDSSTKGSAV